MLLAFTPTLLALDWFCIRIACVNKMRRFWPNPEAALFGLSFLTKALGCVPRFLLRYRRIILVGFFPLICLRVDVARQDA